MGAKNSMSRTRGATRVKKARAGGRWGDGFRERLGILIRAKTAGNQAHFAALCGLHATRVSGWLAGKVLPKLDTIGAIARATSVSVDWLLEGKGHDEQETAEPVYRGQWRTKPDLEDDIAKRIRRDIGALPLNVLTPDDFELDVPALLKKFTGMVRDDMHTYEQWYRSSYQRAESAVHFVKQVVSEYPPREATSLRDAACRADLQMVPTAIAGLCAGPPYSCYVAPNPSAFDGMTPDQEYASLRSEYSHVSVNLMRVENGAGVVEVNGVEVYREP